MNLQILLDVIITRREYRFSWQEYPLFALIITYDCSSFREMTKAEDNKVRVQSDARVHAVLNFNLLNGYLLWLYLRRWRMLWQAYVF